MKGLRFAQSAVAHQSSVLNKVFSTSPTHFLMTRCMSTSTSMFFQTSRPNFGPVTFKLADIGEGIAEVELLRWHIQEGQTIEEMDQVCEVQSDKSAVEISSPFSGKILKFHHQVGDMIKIGAPLLEIDVEGEGSDHAAAPAAVEESKPSSSSTPKQQPSESKPSSPAATASSTPASSKATSAAEILASPACRHLAAEYNINLADVPATGPGGRITKEDVLAFHSSGGSKSSSPKASKPSSASTPSSAHKTAGGEIKEEVLLKSGVQKGMIKSMTQSLSIPMMSIQEDIDISELNSVREKLKTYLTASDKNAKITVTTLLVKAVSNALKKIPIMNSKFDVQTQDKYTIYHNHNISIAIDTPIGLLVPNIKNVETLSLLEIQSELNTLQQLAKDGKLGPTHLTGGTISISNVGVIGGTAVRPILFDGQATILGLGRTQKLPKWDDKTQGFVPRDFMNVTATVDHRHVDGATVARFMKVLREILEQPQLMLL